MENLFILLILLFYLFELSLSILYEVKTLNSLKKSLRILDDDTSFLQEIKGDSNYLNYYYTTLYLGKDKSPQVYILDTGSSITTSPCSKCTSCGNHLNPKYKLNESNILECTNKKCNYVSNSRCVANVCSFHVSYAEGSKLSGLFVNQEVYFETIDSENKLTNISYYIPLGCTTQETHLFKTQLADGIMGLNNNDKSFVTMLYKLNITQKNIFSLCLAHEGGYFSIGKITTSHHFSKNISYVDLLNKNMGNYYIKLDYIKIGNKTIEYNGKAFIDSGTTISYFPNNNFDKIMKSFLEVCAINKKCGNLRRIRGLGYCSKIDNESQINDIVYEGWSNIIVVFDGHEFIWEPGNYYFIYNTKDNGLNVCLGFEGDSRNNILLGTTFMHGYDFIFDKEKYRMGFVPADCNRVRKIEEEENNNNNEKNEEKEVNSEETINIDHKIITDNDININNNDNNNIISDIITYSEINQDNKIIDIKIDKKEKNDKNEVKKNDTNLLDNITLTKVNEINISKNLNTKNTTIKNTSINKDKNNTFTPKVPNEPNSEKNDNQKYITNERIYEQYIINFSMTLCIIIFIVFIVFNIIICKENYISIQNKKNENNISQYELEIPKEDNNSILTLFNDSL